MRYRDLLTTQVRIFKEGTIPYKYFARKTTLDEFKSRFMFDVLETPFPLHEEATPKVIIFNNGEINLDNSKVIIKNIIFDNRKITLRVFGKTEIANKVFSHIAGFLKKLDDESNIDRAKPLVLKNESSCIVNLEIDYIKIFSKKFQNFVKEDLYKSQLEDVYRIVPDSLSFEIFYEQKSKLQADHRITLSPKKFICQPNRERDPEDHEYLFCSPCDTENHFKLIEAFEKLFKS